MLRSSEDAPLWGVIPDRVAVPVLLAAALGLTVLLVVMLESWHSAVAEAISLGTHPQDIPRSDLVKVGVLIFLLAVTTVVAISNLKYSQDARRKLARVKGLSRNVLDNIVSGVLTLDAGGAVTSANPSLCRIFRVSPTITGYTLEWFEEHHPSLGLVLRRAVDRDEFVRDHNLSLVLDEEITWLRVTTTPMPALDSHAEGVIALIEDVTESLAYEKQARRLDRLAVTESLGAGVAHEIRNPLTAIDLNLRLLRSEVSSETPDQEEVNRQCEVLTEETRRLERITDQFLDFSRRSSAPVESIEVSRVVEHVLQLIAPEIEGKRIHLETRIGQSLPPVQGNAERLEQVILNILVNAMEAMPDGGNVDVSVGALALHSGRWIEVMVADDGPGLSEELLSRVFDPYFTTKRSGSGLGLAIAHRIVTDYDGEIAIENAGAGGAVVKVRLPIAAEDPSSGKV